MSIIEDWIAAKRDFVAATDRLSHMGMMLRDLGLKLMSDPEAVTFANTTIGVPGDMKGAHGATRDAKKWPSPEMIQSAVVERYHARRRMEAAWSAIPEEDRASLRPPE